jgi:hypothetical protein
MIDSEVKLKAFNLCLTEYFNIKKLYKNFNISSIQDLNFLENKKGIYLGTNIGINIASTAGRSIFYTLAVRRNLKGIGYYKDSEVKFKTFNDALEFIKKVKNEIKKLKFCDSPGYSFLYTD